MPNILNYFIVFEPILFRGYIIHNLPLCLAHFALLANVTIIPNRGKLLQECHITGIYTQSQCEAVKNKNESIKKKVNYALWDFFIRNSILNNFYLKLFFVGCVFSAVLNPKQNVFYCSHILYFNHINLSNPWLQLVGGGEIGICAHGLLYTKFNS